MHTAPGGAAPRLVAEAGVDAYCTPQNETSTGVAVPVRRVADADPGALLLIDATSGAGGLDVDLTETDVYYFAPQKCFGSDGGLWLALMSPAALERAAEIKATGRYIPAFLDLVTAIEQLPAGADVQHPGAGHHLPGRRADRLDDRAGRAGLGRQAHRGERVDRVRLGRALRRARPRTSPTRRCAPTWSPRSTSTTAWTPTAIAKVLRANGIVDTEPYRKLGRNQLRIALYPAVEPGRRASG